VPAMDVSAAPVHYSQEQRGQVVELIGATKQASLASSSADFHALSSSLFPTEDRTQVPSTADLFGEGGGEASSLTHAQNQGDQ
jgi:hypothetical protein